MQFIPAQLILETGQVFHGRAPATQEKESFGEIVFNTGMVGYVESLTDPSYAGQILVFTYPLIGNYGVSHPNTWESSKIHVSGVIMSELTNFYSSHSAEKSLVDWLTENKIPVMVGVDTRLLTKHLRTKGVVPGVITTTFKTPKKFEQFSDIDWVKKVSIPEPKIYGEGEKLIIAVDCGMKENIIRCLTKFPIRVKRVPFNYDYSDEPFDGVFISNGPGDPVHCTETIAILRKALKKQKPMFGICLGTQLMALAVGAKTYKLPFGHRAQNQPCLDVTTGQCYLTSQNHSYAVDEKTLPADWEVFFKNLNDQSVEGIQHKTLPFFAVQFHPEAAPGPLDTQWLFQKFYDFIENKPAKTKPIHAFEKKHFNKVLILGSGGLRIGQAGEFDYSGSQAIKALKEQGIKTVLVNPNIATVQTDANMADEVYLQPLNIETVTKIIEKEKPDGILLGFGGQTALNLGLMLDQLKVFEKHNITVLGTSTAAIRQTEDREVFKKALESIGIQSPKSICVTTVADALKAAEEIGYPVMMRSGFSLGGLGSGKIASADELKLRAHESFGVVTQILIEEYLMGWKEYEYEIVRDRIGSTLTICNMENLDPMGVHTGESIVIAPAQTLNNREHQALRKMAIQVANHFNIIGECNIQFAIHPKTGDYRVIEVNARLSRSSALASKATGYPLAFVAAKLALGWLLHEIPNSVTQQTCAFFEPALDYVVIKIPRWDTQKLKAANRTIGSEMKSVGEVMSIGRSFPEALQKAVGMLNIGASCLTDYLDKIPNPKNEIEFPTDRRLFALYQFFMNGGTIDEARNLSHIDPWFLSHIHHISEVQNELTREDLSESLLRLAKEMGFSDKAIGRLTKKSEEDIRALRLSQNIIPYVKQIDTLAGEVDAQTNYLYMTYHAAEHDILPSKDHMMVLGSGPYAIGSSVEFDWGAVNTLRTLRASGKKAILINSNPETVSTDYDESDRLYFEQLSFERVQDIADFEKPKGVIVSVGGQIANNLATPLANAGYHLLGTDANAIDQAENREKFSALLNTLGVDQPEWVRVTSLENAKLFAEQVGYPVLIRPSYILSGAAMNVAHEERELAEFLEQAAHVSREFPVVISKFILDAKELEVDGVALDGKIVIEAISEHIENAGVHSGDATLVLPPQRLYLETIRRTKKITQQIASALKITGPFNIQFIAKNNNIQVIECNLRASRSFPFVSKSTGHNFIAIATKAMLGEYVSGDYETLELDYVGVKAPQFSYHRLKGADPVQHVEMASTGEVACLGEDLYDAYWRAWTSTEQHIANKRILVSISDAHKQKLLGFMKDLEEKGWEIYSTGGTHTFLSKNGVGSYFVYKASDKVEPNLKTVITNRKVDLIINIPTNQSKDSETDGFVIRRLAIDHHIPLITNIQSAQIILQCLVDQNGMTLPVRSWREIVG